MMVPKGWQRRAMVAAPARVSDRQMVVTSARWKGARMESRRKEYRASMVGWMPTSEELRKFRQEAGKMAVEEKAGELGAVG